MCWAGSCDWQQGHVWENQPHRSIHSTSLLRAPAETRQAPSPAKYDGPGHSLSSQVRRGLYDSILFLLLLILLFSPWFIQNHHPPCPPYDRPTPRSRPRTHPRAHPNPPHPPPTPPHMRRMPHVLRPGRGRRADAFQAPLARRARDRVGGAGAGSEWPSRGQRQGQCRA